MILIGRTSKLAVLVLGCSEFFPSCPPNKIFIFLLNLASPYSNPDVYLARSSKILANDAYLTTSFKIVAIDAYLAGCKIWAHFLQEYYKIWQDRHRKMLEKSATLQTDSFEDHLLVWVPPNMFSAHCQD